MDKKTQSMAPADANSAIFTRFDEALEQLANEVSTLPDGTAPLKLSDKTRSELKGYLIAVASGQLSIGMEDERAPRLAVLPKEEQQRMRETQQRMQQEQQRFQQQYFSAAEKGFTLQLSEHLAGLAQRIAKEQQLPDSATAQLRDTLLKLNNRTPELEDLSSPTQIALEDLRLAQAALKAHLTPQTETTPARGHRALAAAIEEPPINQHYRTMLSDRTAHWLHHGEVPTSWAKSIISRNMQRQEQLPRQEQREQPDFGTNHGAGFSRYS
ncbi:MAG: hypothetical protein V4735_02425 [Pseudomonadota bacterium]